MKYFGLSEPNYASLISELNKTESVDFSFITTDYGQDTNNRLKSFLQMMITQPDTTQYQYFLDEETVRLFYANKYSKALNIFHTQEILRTKIASIIPKEDIDYWYDFSANFFNTHNEWLVVNIAEQSAKQPTLFWLYLGFIYGEQGVLQKLRREGYTVTPVKSNPAN